MGALRQRNLGLLLLMLTLGGCLVSDEPVLDAASGRAAPLAAGLYDMRPIGEDEDDIERFTVERAANGLYRFLKSGEDPIELRFRRIARNAYAVQSREDAGYIYYYGAGDQAVFHLTMMLCADLPERLRAKLLARRDLASDDANFESCTVKTRRGLIEAAKAYHRGQTTGEENIVMELTRAEEDSAP